MREEKNNQEQGERRSGSWIGLAIGLLSLVGLLTLSSCSKNGANSNTASGNATPSPGAVVKNSIGMEFAYVPAGSFKMGSETDSSSYVQPAHQVTFASGFYMGRHEVTRAQWQKLMEGLVSNECGENCPAEVKWEEIQEFIKKLNAANDGYTYRLPSEAEWEYASRAGTTGDTAGDLNSMAWYSDNSDRKLHPVGQKQPNAWGLYDMLGNSGEWVMDYFHDNYNGAPTDGSAWLNGGEQKYRTVRGGNYFFSKDYASSHGRNYAPPNTYSGFRLAAVAR